MSKFKAGDVVEICEDDRCFGRGIYDGVCLDFLDTDDNLRKRWAIDPDDGFTYRLPTPTPDQSFSWYDESVDWEFQTDGELRSDIFARLKGGKLVYDPTCASYKWGRFKWDSDCLAVEWFRPDGTLCVNPVYQIEDNWKIVG